MRRHLRTGASGRLHARTSGPRHRRGGRLLALALLLLVAPLLGLIALAVKLESPGPAVVRERRRGAAGREVAALRFRTARRGDRRPTRLGALLLRTHLDELPRLVNALRGEATLVGGR